MSHQASCFTIKTKGRGFQPAEIAVDTASGVSTAKDPKLDIKVVMAIAETPKTKRAKYGEAVFPIKVRINSPTTSPNPVFAMASDIISTPATMNTIVPVRLFLISGRVIVLVK